MFILLLRSWKDIWQRNAWNFLLPMRSNSGVPASCPSLGVGFDQNDPAAVSDYVSKETS